MRRNELDNAPTPEEEEASLAGLDLSPMVAERARIEKEKHIRQRMNETHRATDSKASKWNHGLFNPQGGR